MINREVGSYQRSDYKDFSFLGFDVVLSGKLCMLPVQMMEGADFSDWAVHVYHTKRRHIPENENL
jgi:hypothetical protein